MTYVVKNACGGCPTVVTQHLQGSWVGILGEGFAKFEAWRKDILRADKIEEFDFRDPYAFI